MRWLYLKWIPTRFSLSHSYRRFWVIHSYERHKTDSLFLSELISRVRKFVSLSPRSNRIGKWVWTWDWCLVIWDSVIVFVSWEERTWRVTCTWRNQRIGGSYLKMFKGWSSWLNQTTRYCGSWFLLKRVQRTDFCFNAIRL